MPTSGRLVASTLLALVLVAVAASAARAASPQQRIAYLGLGERLGFKRHKTVSESRAVRGGSMLLVHQYRRGDGAWELARTTTSGTARGGRMMKGGIGFWHERSFAKNGEIKTTTTRERYLSAGGAITGSETHRRISIRTEDGMHSSLQHVIRN